MRTFNGALFFVLLSVVFALNPVDTPTPTESQTVNGFDFLYPVIDDEDVVLETYDDNDDNELIVDDDDDMGDDDDDDDGALSHNGTIYFAIVMILLSLFLL